MRILLTNDDGIGAAGLEALHEALSPDHEVVVVAPEVEQSAVGHAITIADPIKVQRVKRDGRLFGWAVTGTPADCVKLAYSELLTEARPDLVVSGINLGANVGLNLLYSGTVSAATEAALLGLRGLAFSLDNYDPAADFGPAAAMAAELIGLAGADRLGPGEALNINFPNGVELGLERCRLTRQGLVQPRERFVERRDPRGHRYFWQAGEELESRLDPVTDQAALAAGYISVTPIHFDLTDRGSIEEWGRRLNLRPCE